MERMEHVGCLEGFCFSVLFVCGGFIILNFLLHNLPLSTKWTEGYVLFNDELITLFTLRGGERSRVIPRHWKLHMYIELNCSSFQ